jgi:mono/diheme cytochrome c family protein
VARGPAILLCLMIAGPAATTDGEYRFNAAGCLACHTDEDGQPLAGGRPFETPFGIFYSPNISPDRETGIGSWTRADFIRAVRHGIAPDGSAYFPVFPYPSYRLMTEDDAAAIYDYLRTVPPRRQRNRPHDLRWWLGRWMMKPWQWWILEPPAPPPTDPQLRRGRYLVDALGHCGECHTPRKFAGVSDQSRYLAGTSDGPDGETVPNITPDRDNGLGKWDDDDLEYFLQTGALPNGDYTGSLMSEVIDNVTSRLTADDTKALLSYLRSVPAIAPP